MNAKDYRAGNNVFDMQGNPITPRPENWNRKKARGLSGAADFVYDPITGMPIADPSGELRASGYETAPAEAVSGAVKRTLDYLTQGMSDFVYDPVTGMPIADPSGELRARGFETMPADAALAIGSAAAAAVGDGLSSLTRGLKYLLVGALVVGSVVLVAEGTKLSRDAFGSRKRR